MTKRIFSTICAMVILTTVLTEGLVSALLYDRHLSEIKQTIRAETEYIASYMSGRTVSNEELQELSSITQGRVTWIASDGTVLFDSVSRPETMENHADRQEVIFCAEKWLGRGYPTFSDAGRFDQLLFCTPDGRWYGAACRIQHPEFV